MNRYQRYKLYNLPDCLCDIVESYYAPNKFKDVILDAPYYPTPKAYKSIISIYEDCAISMFGQHDYKTKIGVGCFKRLQKKKRVDFFGASFANIRSSCMLEKTYPYELDTKYLNICLKPYDKADKENDYKLKRIFYYFVLIENPFGFFKILEYSARLRFE